MWAQINSTNWDGVPSGTLPLRPTHTLTFVAGGVTSHFIPKALATKTIKS